MAKAFDDITEEEFRAFEGVRESGVVNMWSPQVRELAEIDRETHVGIITYYSKLCQKWPDVRKTN